MATQTLEELKNKFAAKSAAADVSSNFNFSTADANADMASEGAHEVEITCAKLKPRIGNPNMQDVLVVYKICNGTEAGIVVFVTYVLNDVGAGQRYRISVANFGKLLVATQIPEITSADDLSKLVGKKLIVNVKHSVSSKTGRSFANISSYRELQS